MEYSNIMAKFKALFERMNNDESEMTIIRYIETNENGKINRRIRPTTIDSISNWVLGFSHTPEKLANLFIAINTWEHSRRNTNSDELFGQLAKHTDPETLWLSLEPFARTVHQIVFQGKTKSAEDGTYYEYSTGAFIKPDGTSNPSKEIKIYGRHLLGLEKIGSLNFADIEINGKTGIVDTSNPNIKNLTQVWYAYRNPKDHGTNVVDTPEERVKGSQDHLLFPIANNSMLLLIAHILDYRYDELVQTVGIGSVVSEPKDYAAEATKYVDKDYCDYLIKTAEEELGKFPYIPLRVSPADIHREASDYDHDNPDDEDGGTQQQTELFDAADIVFEEGNSRMIICAGSGAGKSTTLTMLMKELAEHWKNSTDTEKWLPVRFNFSAYNPNVNIEEFCVPKINNSSLDNALDQPTAQAVKEYFNKLLREGRVIFLMDGINEVDNRQWDSLKSALQRLFKYDSRHVRFVISTRIREIGPNIRFFANLSLNENNPIKYFNLQPFTSDQIEDYIRKRFATAEGEEDPEFSKTARILRLIRESPTLRILSDNPLQLKLITEILDSQGEFDLKFANRASLYDRYLEEFLSREFNKESYTAEEAERKKNRFKYVMSRIASTTLSTPTLVCNRDQLNIMDADPYITLASKMGWVNVDDDIQIKFTHESFTNYYGALSLLELDAKESLPNLIGTYIVERNSPELLRMLVELATIIAPRKLPLVLTSYFNLMREGMTEPGINPGLITLSEIMPYIPEEKAQRTNPHNSGQSTAALTAHALFDGMVLNLMNEYRLGALDGKHDFKRLSRIMRMIADSGSERLIDELFTPFWIGMWAIRTEDLKERDQEYRRSSGYDPKYLLPILGAMMVRPLCFNFKFFDLLHLLDTAGLRKSGDTVKCILMKYWTALSDDALNDIYNYLLDNEHRIPYARSLAIQALASMETPTWVERFNEKCQNWTIIVSYNLIAKQLPNLLCDGEVANKLFDCLIRYINTRNDHMSIHQVFLLRMAREKKLRDRIVSHILPDIEKHPYQRSILDFYPLNSYSAEETKALNLDQDVVRFTADAVENDGSRLPYIVANIGEKTLSVLVPDVTEDFVNSFLMLPDHQDGLQRKQYQPYLVKSDEYSKIARTRFRIVRADGLDTPLPRYGKCTYIDANTDKEIGFPYLATYANGAEIIVDIYFNEYTTPLINTYKQHNPLWLNQIKCSIKGTDLQKAPAYRRILQLERKDHHIPIHTNVAMIMMAEGQTKKTINFTLRTPPRYRQRFYLRVLPNSGSHLSHARYAVYGYEDGKAILWTEASDLPRGSILAFEGSDTTAIVRSIETFRGYFAELHLSAGAFTGEIPQYGVLKSAKRRFYSDIPYIMVLNADGRYVVRVDNSEWVLRMAADPKAVETMINEHIYYIGSTSFRISVVDIIRHAPGSKRLTVEYKGQTPASEGFLFLPDSSREKRLLMKFMPRARMSADTLREVEVVERDEEGTTILSVNDDRWHTFPAKLILRLPGDSMAIEAKRITSDDEKPRRISIDSKEIKLTKGVKLNNIELLVYNPVSNKVLPDIFTLKNQYTVHEIHFELRDKPRRRVVFPAPSTPLDNLYCQVGRSGIFKVIENDLYRPKYRGVTYFDTQSLNLPDDVRMDVDNNGLEKRIGTLRFFYDSAGKYPVVLEYGSILSQVELSFPYRYHGDSCDIMFREARAAGRFEPQLCEMLTRHSRAELLLREYLADPPEVRRTKYPASLKFNIGTVIYQRPMMVCVYSPKDQHIIPSHDVSTILQPGQLVLIEEDQRLIPLTTDERLSALGYVTGVVIRQDKSPESNEGDVHIRVPDFEDFFYHYSEDEALELGDAVEFMPSANPLMTEKNMASKLIKKGSVLREGTVTQKTQNNENTIFLTVEDNQVPGLLGVTKVYPTDASVVYEAIKEIEVGDLVKYIQNRESVSETPNSIPSIHIIL